MKSFITAGVLAFALLSNAQASTIVSTIGAPGKGTFSGLGATTSSGTAFGQTFTVLTPDTKLTSFTFNLTPVVGTLLADFELYAWDGSNRVGAAIYQSSVATFFGGEQPATFSPNVILNQGGTYIAFLNTADLGNSNRSTSGFQTVSDSGYSGGTFVYEYRGRLTSPGRDSSFSATFTNPVPEPETYAMLMAGLGLIGTIARRRKQGQA